MLNDKKKKLLLTRFGVFDRIGRFVPFSGFGDSATFEHRDKVFGLGNGCTIFKLAEGFLCYSFVLSY
ncbi:hypothetical protein [Peribacillus frigoritolerans]